MATYSARSPDANRERMFFTGWIPADFIQATTATARPAYSGRVAAWIAVRAMV